MNSLLEHLMDEGVPVKLLLEGRYFIANATIKCMKKCDGDAVVYVETAGGHTFAFPASRVVAVKTT